MQYRRTHANLEEGNEKWKQEGRVFCTGLAMAYREASNRVRWLITRARYEEETTAAAVAQPLARRTHFSGGLSQGECKAPSLGARLELLGHMVPQRS